MPCPTGGAQVLASGGAPASLGAVVQVVAIGGVFGSATATSGTVTLQRPGVAPRAVPAAAVLWSPTAVAFTVPNDLASPVGDVAWEVRLQATGSSEVCGPYPLIVRSTACPTGGAQVITAGGIPANLGSPVEILALGGVFGSPSATSGAVTLQRPGVQPRVIPADQVLWTPAAVTFTVPTDLPVSPGDVAWEVRLQPTGSTDVCGPYTLKIRAMPILLFVPPTAVAERRIDAVALGIGPNAKIRFYDRLGKRIVSNIPPQQRTATGIACQMPTLREIMEASTDCDVNQLTMVFYVTLHDPDSGVETPSNEVHKMVVALPPPAMGPLSGTAGPNELIFGDAARPPDLGDQLSLEWVGTQDRGSVTFHGLSAELLEGVTALHRDIGSALDLSNPDLTLATATRNQAEAIRNSGTPAERVEQWTEEKIRVVKPDGWTNGVVLIWRDSLPTMPLVIPEIPIPDLCRAGVLRSALEELFDLVVETPQLTPEQSPEVSLGPADTTAAPLSAAATTLKKLIEDQVAKLEIAWKTLGGAAFAGPTSGPVAATLSTAVGFAEHLLAQPNLIRHELDPEGGNVTFKLGVDIKVSGIPGCADPTTITLATPNITQLPIRLPTLVAFFDQRDPPDKPNAWAGDALVCVHPDTSLLQGFVDRGNVGGVGAARAALTAAIDAAVDALTALTPLFPAMLGGTSLPILTRFASILSTRPANSFVITSEGARGVLDYDPWWWNKASSMFMIGVPDGTTTFGLYEGDNQTSYYCDFRMPAGFLAASYWTLHESAFRADNRPGFTSPPVIPDPGNAQDGRADTYTGGWFGNIAKSFTWR